MMERLMNVWGVMLAVLGLVILAALAVIGFDLRRARLRGPRWRRRVAAAAMALLSAAGAYFAARRLPPELPVIMCYPIEIYEPQPQQPIERLDGRLDLLRRHMESGTLPAAAAQKAMACLREDPARSERCRNA